MIQMNTNEKFVVSFRITHPTMDASTFCKSLGLPIFRYWVAGQPRKSTDGKLLSGVYENSYCSCRLSFGDGEDLGSSLEKWLHLLELHKSEVQTITNSGGDINFFIGWFFEETAGLEFDWKILHRLSGLKISLQLDAYGTKSVLDARGRFHAINQKDKGRGRSVYGVNPSNGSVCNPEGEDVGNLEDAPRK